MSATLARSVLAAMVLAGAGVTTPAVATAQTPSTCTEDWSRVSTPSPGTIYSVLLDVASIAAGDAWSVGYRAYIDANGAFANSPIIERWDGSEWTVAYRPGSQGQLAGVVAIASDDVWAVGHTGLESIDFQPLIMHWNGSNWRQVDSPESAMGYLTAIGGTGPDDLWAAGTLIGTFDTIIEHWDGSAWALVDHPSPSSDYVALGGVAAVGSDNVMIVGSYLDADGKSAPLALHWNGTAWRRSHPLRSGDLGTELSDAAANAGGRVWAVGSAGGVGGDTQAVAERWNGHRWVLVSPLGLDGSARLASVTTGPDGVWAVGTVSAPGSAPSTLTARWRPGPGEWLAVASPNAAGDNYLLGVDQSPAGELWAVGFHRSGEQEKTLALHRCG